MLRKIKIDQLRVGMYVDQVDKNWLDIPFFRRAISSQEQIDRLRKYNVKELKIDTDRGRDLIGRRGDPVAVMAPELDGDNGSNGTEATQTRNVIPFCDEIETADAIYSQATKAVRSMMEDMKAGRYIEEEAAQVVASEMVDSCIRNEDALVSLTTLRGHDEYTFTHSVNVAVYSLVLGNTLGMTEEELRRFGVAVLLHDVGKMLVPPEILHKPGKLTREEFEVMKLHVERGVAFLRESFPENDEVLIVAQAHHERIDGSGYPKGLTGNDVPIWGQIAAIGDIFDALTSRRCYKKEMTPHQALSLMYQLSGGELDTLLVERFIESVGIYPIGSLVKLSTNEVGLVTSVCHSDLLHPTILVLYRGGHRLLRPRLVDLRDLDSKGDHIREVTDILVPEDYGVDAARHIIEGIS